jgi:hypothetical protein
MPIICADVEAERPTRREAAENYSLFGALADEEEEPALPAWRMSTVSSEAISYRYPAKWATMMTVLQDVYFELHEMTLIPRADTISEN